MVSERAAWLAALVACALAPAAAAEPPPCWAEAQVEPARVVPGQQVLYRVRIASRERDVQRVEWVAQPSFPGVRTEPLGGATLDAVEREGLLYRVRAEDRALFVERPGSRELRGAALRCIVAGHELTVPVPPVRLEVEPTPAEGRPEGFEGVVGPLGAQRSVTPRSVALGESVHVAVMVRGEGNLWDLSAPYAPADFPDAELFAERPALHVLRGVRLSLRRHFVYDVVPLHAGPLRIPELRLPYYDPAESRYRVATSPALTVEVAPRPAPPVPAPPAPRPSPRTAASPAALRWLVGLAALAAAALALAAVRRRSAGRPGPAAALAAARRARAAGDPDAEAAALERALRVALAERVALAASVAPDALLARADLAPEVAAAARALRDVERARFDPAAPPVDPAAVERALSGLGGRRRGGRRGRR